MAPNLKFLAYAAMRPLWLKLPPSLRSSFWSGLKAIEIGSPLPPAGLRPNLAEVRRGPIVVSGFLSDSRGIATIARLAVSALRNAGFEVKEHDITGLLEPGGMVPDMDPAPSGVWILCCNPPEAKIVLNRCRALAQAPVFRIGMWAWELAEAPQSWRRASADFHEIWTLSAFQSKAFDGFNAVVRTMPPRLAVKAASVNAARRAGPVRALHISDLRSSAKRKNALGALHAFIRAFPATGEATLTLKISGVDADPAAIAALRNAAKERRDIAFLTTELTLEETTYLIETCDIVISLHRAEGLGLPIAEAMAASKAVILTGWSGMAEFFDAQDRQLIPFTLQPVSDPSGLYDRGQWAEPDIDVAAKRLRFLADNAEARRAVGAYNQRIIADMGRVWSTDHLNECAFAVHASRSEDGGPLPA